MLFFRNSKSLARSLLRAAAVEKSGTGDLKTVGSNALESIWLHHVTAHSELAIPQQPRQVLSLFNHALPPVFLRSMRAFASLPTVSGDPQ